MEEKVKNSIKIEFVDYNGDKHIYYNERNSENNNQIEFVGASIAKFLKSLGWSSELTTEDFIEYFNSNIEQ